MEGSKCFLGARRDFGCLEVFERARSGSCLGRSGGREGKGEPVIGVCLVCAFWSPRGADEVADEDDGTEGEYAEDRGVLLLAVPFDLLGLCDGRCAPSGILTGGGGDRETFSGA